MCTVYEYGIGWGAGRIFIISIYDRGEGTETWEQIDVCQKVSGRELNTCQPRLIFAVFLLSPHWDLIGDDYSRIDEIVEFRCDAQSEAPPRSLEPQSRRVARCQTR